MKGLFPIEETRNAPAGKVVITTPLGDLLFRCYSNGKELSDPSDGFQTKLPNNSCLYEWTTESLIVEAFSSCFRPELPPYYTDVKLKELDASPCHVLLWRSKALTDTNTVTFDYSWKKHNWTESGPCSGQWLDAMAYYNEKVEVTVGTQDDEALTEYHSDGRRLPERIVNSFQENGGISLGDIVGHKENTLSVEIPALRKGETCQVQFLVAWEKHEPEGEDIPSWLSVEISPDHLEKTFKL